MIRKEELKFSQGLNNQDWETSHHYIDKEGNHYSEKPEHMTQLIGNLLVPKDEPRIVFRGKIDSFQSHLILVIARNKAHMSLQLLGQLRELLEFSREILGAEVLGKRLKSLQILSWSSDEIRDRSHNTLKYYNLPQMVLLNDEYPLIVLELNTLRAMIREIELFAVSVFKNDRDDLIEALNRLSSCFHILIYQELSQIK